MNKIFEAIAKNDRRLLEQALLEGTDVNTVNECGETALIVAARKKDLDPTVLQLLLDAPELDVNKVDRVNASALIVGLIAGNKAFVNLLLKIKYREIDFHIQGYFSGTALTYAIFSNQIDIAMRLLSYETRVETSHPTAMNWAIVREHKELIDELVRHGADVNQHGFEGHNSDSIPEWVNHELLDNEGESPMSCSMVFTTPVCCAVLSEQVEMLEHLVIVLHADVNQATAERENALILAARHSAAVLLVPCLLKLGASLLYQIDGHSVLSCIKSDVMVADSIKAQLEIIASLQGQEVNVAAMLQRSSEAQNVLRALAFGFGLDADSLTVNSLPGAPSRHTQVPS